MSDALAVRQVTDAKGRRITFRDLTVLDQMRVLAVIGADRAKIDEYKFYARAAYAVTEIDGIPIPAPTTLLTLEAAVSRLGDDGLIAVIKEWTRQADDAQAGGDEPSPLKPSAQ